MAIYHLLYRTSVAGRVPTAGNMPSGRLGLNLVDERIYFTNASGEVVEPQPRAHTHPISQITGLGDIFQSVAIPPETDLNTYLTPGIYHQNTNAGALNGLNYPIQQAGQLIVYSGQGGNFVYQLYMNYRGTNTVTQNRFFWRAYYATATPQWVEWSEAIPASQKGAVNGVATLDGNSRIPIVQLPYLYSSVLPTTAHNLDDYVTPVAGGFYQTTDAGAAAGTNYPVARAGFLEIVATGTPVMQRYTTRGGTGAQQSFFRTRATSTTWSGWQDASSGSNPVAPLLPTTAHDLDSYVTSSSWVQAVQSGADAGANYPVASPGFLEVVASTVQVLQRFSTLTTNQLTRRTYFRTKGTGSFTNWVECPTSFGSVTYNGNVPDAADLNTYTDRGLWIISGSTVAAGGTNFPAPYSGVLFVMSGAAFGSGTVMTSGVTQLYVSANSSITYTRSLTNGTWSSWAAGSKADVLTTQNLNDVVNAGAYFINSDASATAALNYPILLAGILEVIPAFTGNLQVMQRYTTRSGSGVNPRIFVRNRFTTSSTWYPWVELSTTGFVAQTSTVDTTAGRGLVVGAFGSGSFAPSMSEYSYPADFNLMDDKTCLVTVDQVVANGPNGASPASYTAILRIQRRRYVAGASVTQEMFVESGAMWKRVGTGTPGSTTWTSWVRVLDTSDLTSTFYNHVFLTANTDANTLTADQTYYTWTASSVTNSGTNWPSPAGSGYLRVYRAAASFVVQEACFVSSGAKPRMYSRYGNATSGVWESWKSTSSHSSASFLPNSDCGDIYVDGAGWYRWAGSTYALANTGAPVVTNASTSIALTTVAPNSYTRTTSASPVSVNVSAGAASATSEFHFRQAAGGVITFVPASGVTINPPFGGSLVTSGLGSTVTLKCVDTNVYDLFGVTSS